MDPVVPEYPLPEINRSPGTGNKICAKPPGKQLRVADGGGEPNHLHRRVPVPQFCDYHLKSRPAVLRVDKVDLIDDDECDFVDPASTVS